MEAIRIRRKLDSETLHLPELRPLMGKEVEIIVHSAERADSEMTPAMRADWPAVLAALEELRETGYDFEAWREQRDYDLLHANDHLL